MLKELPVECIVTDASQPRKSFDKVKLQEMAESIRQQGLLQPILVRPLQNGKFQIVLGERRWRACRMAGMKTIRTEIRKINDREKLEIQLIENVQRQDLNPIEEAETFQKMITEFGYPHKILAKRIGKSREYITNKLRLLNLSSETQHKLRTGLLSEGHARAIVSLSKADDQKNVAEQIIEKNLTVRETEELVRRFRGEDVTRETFIGGSLQNKTFLIPISSELYSLLQKATGKMKSKIEVVIEQATRDFLKNKGFSDGVD